MLELPIQRRTGRRAMNLKATGKILRREVKIPAEADQA
jgi:hypothetical protein